MSDRLERSEVEERLAAYLADPGGQTFEEWAATQGGLATRLRQAYGDYCAGGYLLGRHRERGAAAQSSVLAPGACIGEFVLIRHLGSGGQGTVWEAEQASLGRRVALKLIRPDRLNEQSRRRFEREAKACGRLHHPGIVTIYAHGETDGSFWLAQELVQSGRTLRDWIDDARADHDYSAAYYRRVARCVANVAHALEVAHRAGVVHRDVKPANVLVDEHGDPKLTDFGLAQIRHDTDITATGALVGTHLYMSPEQLSGGGVECDARSDVFSLGVVLYELLALRRPFEGDTTTQVALAVMRGDPPSLLQVRSQIPRDLVVICGKALEKLPRQRYPSAGDLADDLESHLADRPIRARPPTLRGRAAKWAKRNPTPTAALGVAAVASVAISGLALSLWRSNSLLADRTREAELSASAERARAEEVLRLSLSRRRAEMMERAEELWPPHPERIDDYRAWRQEADELAKQLPGLRSERAASSTAEDTREAVRREELIEELESLFEPQKGIGSPDGINSTQGWSIPRRHAFAEQLRAGLADDGPMNAAWEASLPAIRRAYPDLQLGSQIGLVPLGPDPGSALWEFWHVASGERPPRGPDGDLVMGEESGLVFVLLPGGDCSLGAQATDPGGLNYDPAATGDEAPVHMVELSPFFISKFEMSQGQWKRLTGANPSRYGPDGTYHRPWNAGRLEATLLEPIEHVSWQDCERVLGWFGLVLPTEAQWEYSARGGTTTPWWCGVDRTCLEGVANLADRHAREKGGQTWGGIQDWLYDGYTVHAPVASLIANPFGLHHVHGNVWEWCRDEYQDDFYQRSSSRDPVALPGVSDHRVTRGHAFDSDGATGRSADRSHRPALYSDATTGVRPARALDR